MLGRSTTAPAASAFLRLFLPLCAMLGGCEGVVPVRDTSLDPGDDTHTGTGTDTDTGTDTGADTGGDTGGDTDTDTSGPPLSAEPLWRGEGLAGYDWYGFSVASAGDVDGDGYDDVVIGVRNSHIGEPVEGAVYVHAGGPRGPAPVAAWELHGGVQEARLGEAVAGVGDVNGDGFDDVVVAAANLPTPAGGNGRVYLFTGGPGGLRADHQWSFDSETPASWLGRSVAGAGDVNGDGYDDVIVGEKYYSGPFLPAEGRVHLFFGSAQGLRPQPAWTHGSGQAGAMLGFSVASAGDVNGDGYGDVIVGAAFWDGVASDEGTAWVFHGGPFGPERTAAWMADPAGSSSLCGYPVSTAGDVDGDGYDDVVMGCMNHSGTLTQQGMVRVYRGSPEGIAGPAWEVLGEQEGAHLGQAVSGGCDVDVDGFGDVLIAASGQTDGQAGEGTAWLYRGEAGGLGATAAWSWQPDRAATGLASASACAGDVNGDGAPDVILGAIGWEGVGAEAGAAWVFSGQPR